MKIYQQSPSNMEELKAFMLVDKEQVIETMTMSKVLFFYDTCSVMHHSLLQDPEPLIQYIKTKNGCIVIASIILMELTSDNGNLKEKEIKFLRRISEAGIPIVLLKEEYCQDCIMFATNQNILQRQELLASSLREMKTYNGAINIFLRSQDPAYQKKVLLPNGNSNNYDSFFQDIRLSKHSGDSLGEELIYLCILLLAGYVGHVVVISDDRSAIPKFLKVIQYREKHYGKSHFAQLCTAVWAYKMYKTQAISKGEMRELLTCAYPQDCIHLQVSTQDSFTLEEHRFTIGALVSNILEDKEFRPYY